MQRLLAFLVAYGAVLLFVVLQVVAGLLLVSSQNRRHNQRFEAAVLAVRGRIDAQTARITGYFDLTSENARLQAENQRLRSTLVAREAEVAALRFRIPLRRDYTTVPDSVLPRQRYTFIPGRTIGNSTNRAYNFITLNIGARHGLKPEMGIITADGVAGLVVAVSEDYAMAMSLLNRDFRLSARVKRAGIFGTLRWAGDDPTEAVIENIPLHHRIAVGDTVSVSAYSSIFPEGLTIGRVSDVRPDADGGFHRVTVRLATDFRRLDYVYAVEFSGQRQLDSLVAPYLNRSPLPTR